MSSTNAILFPIFAMVVLTFAVVAKLFRDRTREMRDLKIRPQAVSTSAQMVREWKDIRSSDNFKNLFEMPVLFYALCLSLAVTQKANFFLVLGAWVYVALRFAHSYIHCTYNKVMHRFFAYMLSCLVLLILWIAFAIQICATF